MKFLKNWDQDEKTSAIRIAGLAVAALTIFILIACVSYLFSWKEDMSLLTDPEAMQAEMPVGNAAGKLGFKTGYLLICELFGLGSFALLPILAAASIRLLLGRWHRSLIKTALIAVFGAFVCSIFLAWCGKLASANDIFGGGLGGLCGGMVVDWAQNLFGIVVTGLLILILIAALLFFASKRFNHWLAGVGSGGRKSRKTKKEDKKKPRVREEDTEEDEDADTGEEKTVDFEPEREDDVPPGNGTDKARSAGNGETSASTGGKADGKTDADESFTIERDSTLDEEVVDELEPIDNRLDPPDGLPDYKFPSLDLLMDYSGSKRSVSSEELARNNNKIRAALANFKIQVSDVKAVVGPTVTLYKVKPAPGVKIAEIKKLQDDVALSLKAKGVRIVTLTDAVGIEVANDFPSVVPLKSLLNDASFRESKAELPVAIGYTITQKVKVFDLTAAPHLLVAGATQQGKSVGINVIVSSLIYSKHPSELKFVFIDPKSVEFTAYSRLYKHYLAVLPHASSEEEERDMAIVKDRKLAEQVLRSLCIEMDERYALLAKAGVNKITLYNEKYKERRIRPDHGHRFLPYIVTIIDEYADLTPSTGVSPEVKKASNSIMTSIMRLAQKGRAAGLHIILATQRPSVKVISGDIKGNFPMRMAFKTYSKDDSMVILDSPGAEKLIGRGDMLFSTGIENERIQCGLISVEETEAITEFIAGQQGYRKSYNTPYYLPEVDDQENGGGSGGGGGSLKAGTLDERFEEAARLVVMSQKGSTSELQRKLGMGFAKAGRVMDQLYDAGIVGPQEGSKARTVLVSSLDELDEILKSLK